MAINFALPPLLYDPPRRKLDFRLARTVYFDWALTDEAWRFGVLKRRSTAMRSTARLKAPVWPVRAATRWRRGDGGLVVSACAASKANEPCSN
jgi:hypothetical protein